MTGFDPLPDANLIGEILTYNKEKCNHSLVSGKIGSLKMDFPLKFALLEIKDDLKPRF